MTYGDRSQDGRGIGLVITANFGRRHGTDDNEGLGCCNKRQGSSEERVKEGGWVLRYMYVS